MCFLVERVRILVNKVRITIYLYFIYYQARLPVVFYSSHGAVELYVKPVSE